MTPLPHRPLGIHTWFGLRVPYLERLSMIRAAGFEAVSVWWEEDREGARELRERVPGAVRDVGLVLDHLHVPYRGCDDLWSSDGEKRRAMVSRHLGWVEDCARHKVPTMVMHATLSTRAERDVDAGLGSFAALAERAGVLGVTVAVENTREPEPIGAVLAAIDAPALAFCYDVSHDHLYSAGPRALLRDWGHRLATTHFSDTDLRLDRHWLPGEGAIDFGAVADEFPAAYGGPILLEVVARDRAQGPEAFLTQAFAAATWLADRLNRGVPVETDGAGA